MEQILWLEQAGDVKQELCFAKRPFQIGSWFVLITRENRGQLTPRVFLRGVIQDQEEGRLPV